MQQLEPINVGQQANDGTGDPLRDGMMTVNANFAKVQAGVDAVEQGVASATATANDAKTKADAAVPASQKGMANGVAPLDAAGKVPAAHLPELADYIPLDQKGAADGVAPLDSSGKVPAANLPAAQDSIPLTQKGTPGGVAPLDSSGKVPAANLPAPQESIPLVQKGVAGGVATLDAAGLVPVAQVGGDFVAINAALQALDGSIGFTIIYPNGGTAASPANIAVNSRYVSANPFPGYRVFCQLELRIGGVWGSPGGNLAVQGGGAEYYGCLSMQFNDDTIVTQTAITYLLSNNPGASLHPFTAPGAVTSAPARIKVWKIKGASS